MNLLILNPEMSELSLLKDTNFQNLIKKLFSNPLNTAVVTWVFQKRQDLIFLDIINADSLVGQWLSNTCLKHALAAAFSDIKSMNLGQSSLKKMENSILYLIWDTSYIFLFLLDISKQT